MFVKVTPVGGPTVVASAFVVRNTWVPEATTTLLPLESATAGLPGTTPMLPPRPPALLALPQVRVAARVNDARRARVAGDRCQVAALIGRSAPRRDVLSRWNGWAEVRPVPGRNQQPGA